ncbi:hypothetical protein [Pontibacillus halophilus]|uniref:hypothetical protein n=1 Tax=Pontibacillus halophilus TaxID=516704 RepID=UPI00040D5409|nr:hypothetical protein [Pontibacillus halophilus]
MLLKKGVKVVSCGLVLGILLLAGCDRNDNTMRNNYYLSLSGESKNWKVDSYEVVMKPDTFKVGNGRLSMKNQTEYSTDFLSLEVYAVIDNQDRVVQEKSVKGTVSDITQITMGTIEGGNFITENEAPISLEHISDIYMMIEWKDKRETKEEKIELYN